MGKRGMVAKLWSWIDSAWWFIPLAAGLVVTLELLGPTGLPFGKKTATDPVLVLFALVAILQSIRLHRFELGDN